MKSLRAQISGRLMSMLAALSLHGVLLVSPTLAQADGRVFVNPQVTTASPNEIVRFAVRVEGVPVPGFASYGVALEFSGSNVNLVNDLIITASVPGDQVSCSVSLADGEPVVQEIITGLFSLRSGQGDLFLNSQGDGGVLRLENSLSGNTARFAFSVSGTEDQVTPQTGDGDLFEILCFVGASVPEPTTITVTPKLFDGEDGSVFLFGAGTPFADTTTGGTIQVGGAANRPPELSAIDSRSLLEGQSVTIALSADDPDGDALSFRTVNLPAFCSLNQIGATSLSCSPGFGDAGAYPITVAVDDNGTPSLTDEETFTLTVEDVNRAPDLAAIGSQSVDEDATVTTNLSATDPDSDTISFSATGLPGFCSLTDNGNGTASISCAPGFDDADAYNISVTVTDNGSPVLDDSDSFTLTVNDVNREPTLASIGDQSVNEEDNLTISLSATDPDGDGLSYSASGLPGFCSLADNGNGAGSIDCAPESGDADAYNISVTVTDDGTPALNDVESFTLTVVDVNSEPELSPIGNQSVDEDATLTINLSAADPDENGLSYATTNLPDFCALTDNGDGTGAIGCAPGFEDADTYSVTVTVTDDGTPPLGDAETFTLTVVDVNREPELSAIGNQSVDEDDTLTINLSATDPDQDGLGYTTTGLPDFCNLTDNSDGTATIVCTPGFEDADAFNVTVTVTDDGTPNLEDAESFTLTVNDVNRNPELATIGDQSVEENDAISIPLIGTDPDGDGLTITASGLPSFCTLTDNGDGTGSIDCAPGPGDAGVIAVTVIVTDDGTPNLSDEEGFSLSIGDVNQPPTLDSIGDQTVDEGDTLTVALSANDPDGDTLTFSEDGLPNFCVLTDNGDGTGSIACDPGLDDAGELSVTVTVTDDGTPNLDAEETFNVSVINVNQAPTLGGIGNQSVEEGGILMVPLGASDPDEGDVLSFSEDGLPAFCGLSDNGDGTGSVDCAPGFADAGVYSVTVIVTDDGTPSLVDEETFNISVGNVNQSPMLNSIGNQSVDEGGTLTVSLVAGDPDDGDNLTFSQEGLPAFCELTDEGGGAGSISCNPDFGDTGVFTVTVTVTDDGSPNLDDAETFTLSVGAVNQAPTLGEIGNQSVSEGETLTISLGASDPDGNTLSFSVVGLPGFCSLADNGDGTGSIDCAPDFADDGVYSVTVIVTDDGTPSLTAEGTFNISVGNVNQSPVLDSIGNQSVDEGDALTVDLGADDPDLGDTLTFSQLGLPDFCTLTDDGDGTGSVDCNPAIGDAGVYTVTVTVTDDGVPNLDDAETFTLSVGAVNRAPTLSDIGDQSVSEGAILTIPLVAIDPEGDSLTFSQIGLPEFCNLNDAGDGTGSIDCAPGSEDAGVYTVTVTVADDGTPSLEDDDTFNISVDDGNDPPTLNPIGNQSVDEGGTLTVNLGADDSDGNNLTFSAVGLPDFCILTDNGDGTGSIDCDPGFEDAGVYIVTVTVTDDGEPTNLDDSETFSLSVEDVDQPTEPGDINGDGDVDRDDIALILAARNQPAEGPDDMRDLDRDGVITVLDARIAVTRCTRPGCANN